jgi:hypothetical protein
VVAERERVLFIGTQFSNLYTTVDTSAEAAYFPACMCEGGGRGGEGGGRAIGPDVHSGRMDEPEWTIDLEQCVFSPERCDLPIYHRRMLDLKE